MVLAPDLGYRVKRPNAFQRLVQEFASTWFGARVVARPASEAECAAVLADSAGVYGSYLEYVQRISGRRVRIFLFEPV